MGGLDGPSGIFGVALRYGVDDLSRGRVPNFHRRAALGVGALAVDQHLHGSSLLLDSGARPLTHPGYAVILEYGVILNGVLKPTDDLTPQPPSLKGRGLGGR